MDGLEHAEQLDRLVGGDPDQVEHGVVDVAVEDVARLELGRRHPLDRVLIEDLPDELGLRGISKRKLSSSQGLISGSSRSCYLADEYSADIGVGRDDVIARRPSWSGAGIRIQYLLDVDVTRGCYLPWRKLLTSSSCSGEERRLESPRSW